jgi:threonine aldolase
MTQPIFDLRSDTVTQPSPAMREAMAQAEVGDDVYREDPTMQRLEQRTAEIVGKEGALFVPSGTMANQIALLCHTRPGDEAVVGEGAHCAYYESGAGAAWSGLQFEQVGRGGLFSAADLEAAIKPRAYYCPNTSLVVIENTHNRGGGLLFPSADVKAIAAVAKRESMALHLDGARIWNAAAADGVSVAALCAPFDSVSVCFSKGLGAPVGSAVCGSTDFIAAALRFRKMLGGGMRQAGIIAAGALYALEHNRQRVSEDNAAAKRLASALREIDGVTVGDVQTNIVNVDVSCDSSTVVDNAKKRGVLFSAISPKRMRLVTHLGVADDFDGCIERIVEAHREAMG